MLIFHHKYNKFKRKRAFFFTLFSDFRVTQISLHRVTRVTRWLPAGRCRNPADSGF